MRSQGKIAAIAFLLAIAACRQADAASFPIDQGTDLIGTVQHYTTTEQDTLLEIARRYDLGFVELMAANRGTDPWVPGSGVKLRLPTAHLLPKGFRHGIVLNLAEQRLYFFPPDGKEVLTFPAGTGKAGSETPLVTTHVAGKRKNPTWVPPASIRAERPELPSSIPPGPDNPLGAYAIDLRLSGYVIHGTNKPFGIGRRVSHGCVRLYPEDIAVLYSLVIPGTPVTIIDQPVKTGWAAGELYLEVHPSQNQADEIEATGLFSPEPIPELKSSMTQAAGKQSHRLNWPAIRDVTTERLGIPLRVTLPPGP